MFGRGGGKLGTVLTPGVLICCGSFVVYTVHETIRFFSPEVFRERDTQRNCESVCSRIGSVMDPMYVWVKKKITPVTPSFLKKWVPVCRLLVDGLEDFRQKDSVEGLRRN